MAPALAFEYVTELVRIRMSKQMFDYWLRNHLEYKADSQVADFLAEYITDLLWEHIGQSIYQIEGAIIRDIV